MNKLDHPIFLESISFIRSQLGKNDLDPFEQNVLERLIHSSGDFGLESMLRFTPNACQQGLDALKAGAPILVDTAMAAAAVSPMNLRTLKNRVHTVLEWAPLTVHSSLTRTAVGMQIAWNQLSNEFLEIRSPVVAIGRAPKALETLLDLVADGYSAPSLIVGMPVGFIGVEESKRRLSESGLPHIRLDGTRGGAGLAAAAINALLRASIDCKLREH